MVQWYERVSFETVGKCTFVEALKPNVDGYFLPGDTTKARYPALSGLVMMYTISETVYDWDKPQPSAR